MIRASSRLAALLIFAVVAPSAPGAVAADRIDTVAGSAGGGFGGDGALATNALLSTPSDVEPVGDGAAYLIADTRNNRIRRVDAAGTITTVAGGGPCCGAAGGYAGDGLAAAAAPVRLNQPRGIAALPGGGFLIADTGNNRIRRVDGSGLLTTVAGTGAAGNGGDGDAATGATLNAPGDVAALPGGGFLIADTGNHVVRRVSASGIISTVAGPGTARSTTGVPLVSPVRVVPLAGGGFLIADSGNNRIRRVEAAGGAVTTVAGSSAPARFGGDGGPATAAALNRPEGVAVRDDGAIVIADTGNHRLREVGADGVIRTIAGTGTAGFGGDGGSPLAAQLAGPRAVALSGTRLRLADSANDRVRTIVPAPPVAPRPADPPPPRQTPPGVSPPLIGRSTVAAPVGGSVRVRLPGTRRFVALGGIANIPLGSELDTRAGRASVLFATTAAGRKASAIVSGGRVIVRQFTDLDLGQRPGTLVLSGPLAGCRDRTRDDTAPSARRRAAARTRRKAARPGAGAVGAAARAGAGVRAASRPRAAAAARKQRGRKGRRARVHADGRIEVRGRYGAAIVRGTRWTTVDRCPADPRPGTFFAVAEGRVRVTAYRLRRSRIVRGGQRYLAPASAPVRRRR